MDFKNPRIKIAAILIGVALLFLSGITVMKLMPFFQTKTAAEKVQVVAFDDGAQLEVLGMSIGQRVVETAPKNKKWLWYLNERSGSGFGTGMINIKTEAINGEVFRSTAQPLNNALLLDVRLKEKESYHEFSRFLSNETNSNDPSVLTPKNSISFKLKDDQLVTICAEMVRTELEILVQYKDSRGAWVSLLGPCAYNKEWKERYLFTLPAWERDKAMLELRAIRSNGKVVEFAMKNPDLRNSPAPISTVALPYVFKGAGYDLTIEKVDREDKPGNHPFSTVSVSASTRLRALSCNMTKAEDEWGNQVDARYPYSVAFLPSSYQVMRASFSVYRAIDFPRLNYTGFSLAEGVVTPDGSHVRFSLLTDGKRMGCKPMTTVPLLPYEKSGNDWGRLAPKDWISMKLTADVNIASPEELKAIQKRIGDINKGQFLIFPADSNESAGVYWSSGDGGGGGGSLKSTNYWLLPPEMVKPGARIRIGLHAPMPDESITVDLPTH